MKKINYILATIGLLAAAGAAIGQSKPAYTYASQKAFIPAELGKVYLGMPLKDFAKAIDLAKAESDYRYSYLELVIPFAKGSVTGLRVRVHGLTPEQLEAIHTEETVKKKGENGDEYEATVKRLKISDIPAEAVVYSMYISFDKAFDLRKWAEKTYGKGEIRAKDDEYYFYDQQWAKRSGDGLGWLIRAFYEGEGRTLQLLGRVPGTEWDPEA
ncbi:MAG: HPF/RaiA family ribosome-associated protein [Acidobacteria bacterium]|nr:HPF/RaiA family ribosome-associated protein [Acidobacteriota bacterium]